MKQFACGDVVPGCQANWERSSDDEILRAVAVHAAADHGMTEVPDSVVQAVLAKITST